MASWKTLMPSKYMKKEDVTQPVLVTMQQIKVENTAPDGQAPEMKPVAYFAEMPKGMILNSTNCKIIEKITGTDDYMQWSGRQYVLYFDPNVQYKGELTGGIRIRAPKQRQQVAPQVAQGYQQAAQQQPVPAIQARPAQAPPFAVERQPGDDDEFWAGSSVVEDPEVDF
jgi:hypothetical protein